MATLAVDAQLDFWWEAEAPRGGERTLEDVILGAWEALAAVGEVDCPACGSPMRARYGAHARPVGGRCGDCGTGLT